MLSSGRGENEARALAYATLVIANLGLIMTNRSWSRSLLTRGESPNYALLWVIGGGTVFLALALYLPVLRNLFRFSFLHANDIALCLGAGIVSIAWFEGLKFLGRLRRNSKMLSGS